LSGFLKAKSGIEQSEEYQNGNGNSTDPDDTPQEAIKGLLMSAYVH
jgi:hypothetical protein